MRHALGQVLSEDSCDDDGNTEENKNGSRLTNLSVEALSA